MGEDRDSHEHIWAYGHAIIEQKGEAGPISAPAKMCGCGLTLVADDEIGTGDPDDVDWYQPSMYDWNGQLISITVTIHVEYSRDEWEEPEQEGEDEIQTSTGPGGSSEHVPGT